MAEASELQKLQDWRGPVRMLASFLALFSGLCTVFALAVTATQAWQEHVEAQWPEATAQVQRCGLDIYMRRAESYRIDCSIRYTVSGEEVASHVHSRSTPAPRRVLGSNPEQQFDSLQAWVNAHPKGTPIMVHFDPADHRKAVLVGTDMPLGGSPTPDNLKLLGAAAGSCIVLLLIARIMRPRSVTVEAA
jgi:hypothetical protein